jgi:hypothetical protein
MSSYSFTVTNYEIPEVDNSSGIFITVKEAIEFGRSSLKY